MRQNWGEERLVGGGLGQRASQRRLDLHKKQWGVSKGLELQSDRVRFVF